MKKEFVFITRKGIAVALIAVLTSCGGNPSDDEGSEVMEDTTAVEESGEQKETAVYYVTPSVMEIAAVIKTTGATFNSGILNPVESKKRYSTQYKRAVNMGVYGADLAYAAMYEETQTALNYLKTIKEMTDDMGMDGIFEESLIKQIQSNISNRDSLLGIISDFFWSSDAYLEDNDRGEMGAMIVAGGWIEATFISTSMAVKAPSNQAIRDRIAEQKLIAKNLVMLMKGKISEGNAEGQALLEKVLSVKSILDNVGLDQTTGRVISNDETSTTDIENSSKISMSEADLKALNAKVTEVRNELIK